MFPEQTETEAIPQYFFHVLGQKLMPKRSFASIREYSNLRHSRVFGDGSGERALSVFRDPVNISIHNKGIVGYTGHNEARNVPLQVHLVQHSREFNEPPPGYTGFIPGTMAESVFGKSKGSIISAHARRLRNG
jgi:hypothetical protein